MEQPPGSSDDLRSEDVTASNISTVIDLTRKTTTLDALRVVKTPSWYPNSRTADPPGLQFSQTGSSDVPLQSGDQIQPDNAFSHTTVTLSYVRRSHVYPAHDSLSQHTPLYSVPAISKFALHPHCDPDNGLGEATNAVTHHDLEQAEPMNLAMQQTGHFHSSGPESDEVQEQLGFNGEKIYDESIETPRREEEEQHLPQENSRVLENGQLDGQTSSGECDSSLLDTGEDEDGEKPEVLFVKNGDSVIVSDGAGVRDLCSLHRDYRSPLEDPVSPSATSLDGVEDVFVLPQASSSPSAVSSFLETPEVTCDTSSIERTTSLDSSDKNKPRSHRRKSLLEPLIDLTDGVLENDQSGDIPHMNGNAKVLERTLKERKLPLRSGRGTRLEAIVMNINSSRYNVSGCILTNNKTSASESATHDSIFAAPNRNGTPVRTRRGKVKRKAVKVNKKGKSCNVNTDCCKESTSDSELKTKKKHNSIPPKSPHSARAKTEAAHPAQTVKSRRKPSSQSSPTFARLKNSKKEPELLVEPQPSAEVHVSRFPPASPSKSPKKSQTKTKSPARKATPAAKPKAANAPKRRRKKLKPSQSSMFSPKEPEIKLKYVNFKEEKRDQRSEAFCPFVRVERQQALPSCCTVVNYPEEVKAPHRKQQQAHASGFISNVVPSTSCLQLGRASAHSQHQRALVCCLCGQSANAIDLGDLHGPYYPEGYRADSKTPTSTSGLKEDDYSDSDSSSCSMRGRGRKRALPPTGWALRPGVQLKQKGLAGAHGWTGDGTGSPAAKRIQSDTGPDVEDWYSPPVLPLEPCEYWIHEDCSIWSAGVFLVKGKVYGLEEAVKVAQETMCSACHNPGATLGCFFKGCPNKYHYRCSLESDCVLFEENFSMKCKKHKNKTIKAPPGSRWDNR